MSELNLSCPKCKSRMVCDESQRGTQVGCPACGSTVSVPLASWAPSGPTRKASGQTRKPTGFTLQKLIGAALILGLLAALGFPVLGDFPPQASRLKLSVAAFLIGAGGVLVLVTGVLILINAFRESVWWGLGFFAPIIGGFVSLAFIIKHWGQNGKLFLTNLGGTLLAFAGAAMIGATAFAGLVEGSALEAGGDNPGFAGSSNPLEAFNGFQSAARQNDYSSAFKYLTPELQNEELDTLVNMIVGARMMKGDAKMKQLADEGAKVLNQDGLPVSKLDEEFQNKMQAAFSGKKPSNESEQTARARLYANIPDKGRLYQDLNLALKGVVGSTGETDMLASLAKTPITGLTVNGTTATGKAVAVGGIPVAIHFKQSNQNWLIAEIEITDVSAVAERLAQAFGKGTPGASAGPVKAPPQVEDRVVTFQRQSALSGNRTAQYDLGMRYLRGDGVEQDNAQAEHWLKLAAAQGESRAARALAQLPPHQN
jgi:TPR repeat protein